MQIPDNPPAVGKSETLDIQFGAWWKFLNGLGVAAFLMFTQCVGLNEWRHLGATLSCVLIVWAYAYGTRYFPPFVRHLRRKNTKASRSLESALWKDYLYRRPWAYLPMYIGIFTLFGLAISPALEQNWGAYVPY